MDGSGVRSTKGILFSSSVGERFTTINDPRVGSVKRGDPVDETLRAMAGGAAPGGKRGGEPELSCLPCPVGVASPEGPMDRLLWLPDDEATAVARSGTVVSLELQRACSGPMTSSTMECRSTLDPARMGSSSRPLGGGHTSSWKRLPVSAPRGGSSRGKVGLPA